jgi:hypothetical protein
MQMPRSMSHCRNLPYVASATTWLRSVATLTLGLLHGSTVINGLVLILNFRDAKSANFVLQGRTFESEPFGGSPLACNSSGRSS